MTQAEVSSGTEEQGPPAKVAKVFSADAFLVKRLSEHAILPVRGSAGAAGYDLARYDGWG